MLEKDRLYKEADNAINWIKEYVEKAGAKGVVIGNSGGKDSAVVIAMASKALGADKVLTVSMPCQSIATDFNDAKLVADTFNTRFIKIDLTETFEIMMNEINRALEDTQVSVESCVNVKPRLRMTTLYSIAQTYGYLVLGTGNLCEAMVGYTTKWGDSASDFNPIGNFTIDEVLAIGAYLGVPEKILKKAPADGLGKQTDEEKMGIKYSQIAEMIETGNTDEKAKVEILRRYNASKHKRTLVPVYKFDRKNHLLDY
ncbi:MAG: NAD(+) synthase [Clostridia bacterium]|nr:NAD(+) synthase [Clostridia bacterium]